MHLLRDIHHLKEQHPTNEALLGWAAAIKNIYQCACAERGPDPAGPRAAQERLLLGGGPGGDGGPSLNDPGVSNGDPQESQKMRAGRRGCATVEQNIDRLLLCVGSWLVFLARSHSCCPTRRNTAGGESTPLIMGIRRAGSHRARFCFLLPLARAGILPSAGRWRADQQATHVCNAGISPSSPVRPRVAVGGCIWQVLGDGGQHVCGTKGFG